jgi:hypothetical protein
VNQPRITRSEREPPSKLHVVTKTGAPAAAEAGMLGELPGQVRIELAGIGAVAREGLLALSVAAGMAVMQAMFEEEIEQACGPRGRHDPGRAAVRHGTEHGSVALGGRRVPVERPRARTVDGHEVPLAAYRLFSGATDPFPYEWLCRAAPRADPVGLPDELAPEAAQLIGASIGCARVSTTGQILDGQTRALTDAG